MSDLLLWEVNGPCATITLNKPQRGNALSPDLQAVFIDYLSKASNDETIAYVVLRANGKYFCTGMDLGAGGGSIGSDANEAFKKGRDFFQALEQFPKPIVSIAQGPCMGGGCGIFFLGDIRLAARHVTFRLTEVLRGLVPALISPTIVREWGSNLAKEAMLTARPISAKELHDRGAISSVFETPEEGERQLEQILNRLKSGGPNALKQVKRLVNAQASTGLALLPPQEPGSTQAARAIKEAFVEMMGPSPEALHGIMTFRETKGKKDVDWYAFYKSKL